MKEKGLHFVIGGLVIAIIIIGIVMITSKKNEGTGNQSTLSPQMQTGGDGSPSQEEIDNAQLIEVDGDVKIYQLPSGGNMKVKGE